MSVRVISDLRPYGVYTHLARGILCHFVENELSLLLHGHFSRRDTAAIELELPASPFHRLFPEQLLMAVYWYMQTTYPIIIPWSRSSLSEIFLLFVNFSRW